MESTIDYIKSFLAYGNADAIKRIGYTRNEQDWDQYALVIVPGKNILTGDKKNWDIPDYNIKPQAERINAYTDEMGETTGGTWVIREDIIYNTAFMLSQAELTLDLPRDPEGRLSCEHSVLGKQGLATIPVLDEYARLCTKLLELPLPPQQFSKVYLTHDIDFLDNYRHLRGFLGGIKRGDWHRALLARLDFHNDPAYTYPWLHAKNKRVMNAEEIFFFKSTPGKGKDYHQYKLNSKDCEFIMRYCISKGIQMGWHSSYDAENGRSKVYFDKFQTVYHGLFDRINERELLRKQRYESQLEELTDMMGAESAEVQELKNSVAPFKIFPKQEKIYHRAHWLRILSPQDLLHLEELGVTDDFSLGWPDHIGFRFGTTRSARFIDPYTLRLTNLTLHPLNIMDVTLSELRYMDIYDEGIAYYTCTQLIDKVRQHGGELCLLWHNTSIGGKGYHSQLYKDVTEYIA